MDDSDLDFTDLCSRLLKRVRRKDAGGPGDEKRPPANDGLPSSLSPSRNPPKRRKKTKAVKTEIKSNINGRTQADVSQLMAGVLGTGRVKDAVIRRMQKFKRASPERLLHADSNQPTTTQSDRDSAGPSEIQHTDPTDDVGSDEALALQLQQELDREARAALDVEEGGLFFCQLCQKDLSVMSPQLRTQHINRCLDASEDSASSASHHSHPRPRVPECPICGKGFKSEKSRSVHIKRCSTDMGVSPNDLLQALRRQAAESVNDSTANQSQQIGGTKRRNGVPAKKKSRRRAQQLDEDTMVALALSHSLLEQEREKVQEMKEEREIYAQLSSPPAAVPSVLQWKPGAGKGRGKRRKGVFPVHPPLLLIQDPQAALSRLQERVSSFLLRTSPPSPPTPNLSPSALPANSHAPLWLKSALRGGGPHSVSEFYTLELSDFIQPWDAPEREQVKSLEATPVKKPPALTSEAALVQEKPSDQSREQLRSTPSPLTPCSVTPGTQALQDLMELAEEGMTLTQYGYTVHTATDKEDAVNELPSSGFVPERNDGKTTKTTLVSFSKLALDLSSMVNNPQLSDVQLQVDSGDVFFTHAFMLYTRCPLLANMVHDTGFGVQEEGMCVAQRVLLGDVPGEAVLALLQYLYTAQCPLKPTMLPHVRELADRFGLIELQQQCEEYSGNEEDPRGKSNYIFPGEEHHLGGQEDQKMAESNFLELLQSMWQHEDSEEEDEFKENAGEDRGMEDEDEKRDGEFKEDRVDDEELDEIYEFAATQKKIETMMETTTKTEEEEGNANISHGNKIMDERAEKRETESILEKSAASCHSNNQGVDGTVAAIVTSPRESHQNQNPETGRLKVSLIPESKAHTNENRDPDASLDKIYDRLFSQSIGEYVEPSQTPASYSQQQQYKSLHTPQRNTPALFHPSCVSEVIDLSISPTLSSGVSGESSFPVPGVSPDSRKAEDMGQSALTKEISCCDGISNFPSPPKSNSQQVELIVLSDSSEEMDMDIDYNAATTKYPSDREAVSPQSSSNSPSKPSLKSKSYACNGNLSTENTYGSQGLDGKPVNPVQVTSDTEPAKSDQSEHHSPANGSVFDGSAEVSWLIPATPVPSMRSSSAQTCVSMRRTQLFPKSCSSASSSSVSTVSDSSKPSTHFASTSGSCLREKPVPLSKLENNSSPIKSDQSPSKEHSSTEMELSPGYQKPLYHLRLSQVSKIVSQPSSSTPLHSDFSLPRQMPFGSLMASDCELRLRDSRDNHSSSHIQGKGGLLSLQLSHSESSPSPCKTPEKKQSTSSLQYRCSRLTPYSPSYGHPERSREKENEGLEQMQVRDDNQNRGVEVVDVAENSPQASVCGMDEPPIAFDDSWGLDAGVGSQKPRFSLRLDSSDGSVSLTGVKSSGQTASLHNTSPLASGAHSKTPEQSPAPFNHSLPDPGMWDDWVEEEEDPLPLSQRLAPPAAKRVAELKTPVACRKKNKGPLVPITPMPGFSDMDTPDLKNRLNRFGVRPLPKKQMVLKLKEIHQYTHQLQSSESEEETSPPRHPSHASNSQSDLLSFKQPSTPPAVSPVKLQPNEEEELLTASQNSTSSAESDRSNPELCVSEDEYSDSEGITASQAVVREKDKLLAVRQFILSDPKLYGRVLQYQPLSLAKLQASLKAAGIRLGAAKLLDFLDSQCITFTTAKQGQSNSSRRKQRGKAATNGPGGAAGKGRKKTAKLPAGVL
ncbi:structure-specific endonuclease subunit SLX4-like isoform X2 [Myxocyprinus asiaticus]|uniref:structure-specific endonuclease subunit SLX4-like isoform X2 n=1 Tax=Myxocyprinus asiaticus TaxID=70543 RepID=UPI002222E64B|nr:structure-specific endonuclease subunit SLX4-like isoform X2 [Myxocyprinus asiaticus]